MKIFSVLAVFFLTGSAWAQNITVSNKVVDRETGEPLPFASIGIKGRPIGTISNLQGDFDFHIPFEYRNDILMVSMLGYKTFEAPVWSVLENQDKIIRMDKSTIILENVIVCDSLQGGDILRIALSRISDNYPNDPFLLEGFYRDIKMVADTYVSLLEAAVKIYDEDYREPRNKFKLRERVALVEVRRSMGYENRFTAFFDQDNLLEDLLLNNNIRYRQFPEEEIFFNNLKREKDTEYDNRPVFVVSHTQDYQLQVYIDKETYGILHLQYENRNQEELERKRGLSSRFARVKRTIDFKWVDNKLYLNFLTVESQINWYDIKTGELKFKTLLNRQLLINRIHPHSRERIPLPQKMKSYGLQYQDQSYNKEFWDNYNVIKESPLDRKIIEDLEKHLPLEKQFKN